MLKVAYRYIGMQAPLALATSWLNARRHSRPALLSNPVTA
jgi:hypothetical protein